MKPKAERFKKEYVHATSASDYWWWQDELEGKAYWWPDLVERFAESYQFALLRGMAVVGVNRSKWNDVFYAVLNENRPFEDLSKLYLQGQMKGDWCYFADRIAMDFDYLLHHPPYNPKWLHPYGYTQQQYLKDLAVYWDDIKPEYWNLWEGHRFGMDPGAVARLKYLGEQARREIDEVAQHSGRYSG